MVKWIKAKWAEVSTKFGLILTAISTVTPQFAPFDRRFAYAGTIAGVLLILFKEGKSDGQ